MNRLQASSASRKKTSESIFLSSVIQATDSTCTDARRIMPRSQAPHLQASQQPPHQQRVGRVQENIGPVIACRFNPQVRARSGRRYKPAEILRRRVQREPNPLQAVRRRQQPVVRYVIVIVPDVAGVPHRLIDEYRPATSNRPGRSRQKAPGRSFSRETNCAYRRSAYQASCPLQSRSRLEQMFDGTPVALCYIDAYGDRWRRFQRRHYSQQRHPDSRQPQ